MPPANQPPLPEFLAERGKAVVKPYIVAMARLLDRLRNEAQILRRIVYQNMYINPAQKRSVVESFHKLYYDSGLFDTTWRKTSWLGTPTLKCPLDLWIYQEIMCE